MCPLARTQPCVSLARLRSYELLELPQQMMRLFRVQPDTTDPIAQGVSNIVGVIVNEDRGGPRNLYFATLFQLFHGRRHVGLFARLGTSSIVGPTLVSAPNGYPSD